MMLCTVHITSASEHKLIDEEVDSSNLLKRKLPEDQEKIKVSKKSKMDKEKQRENALRKVEKRLRLGKEEYEEKYK